MPDAPREQPSAPPPHSFAPHPSPSRAWRRFWAVSGAVVAVAGLVLAYLSWQYPQSPTDATPQPGPPPSDSAAASPWRLVAEAETLTLEGIPASSPCTAGSVDLDAHAPDGWTANTPAPDIAAVPAGSDLAWRICGTGDWTVGHGLSPRSGTVTADRVTPEACLQAASGAWPGWSLPEAGDVIHVDAACVVTDQGALAYVRPLVGSSEGSAGSGEVELEITLWLPV